jgi:hypothetical protein
LFAADSGDKFIQRMKHDALAPPLRWIARLICAWWLT